MKTHFDSLLGDLETLTKAMPVQDDSAEEKIEAAAGDGGDETPGDEAGMADDDKGKKGKKKPMAKSMTVTLEDGTEVEAEDGTELVKSLTESLGALETRIDASDSVLAKAFGEAVTLLKAQGTQIAALSAQVKAMAGEGRGRKAVVTLTDKPNAQGAAKVEEGINPDVFMAKAESQFRAGKLLGQELAYIESAFNRGEFKLPPALLAKVGAAA